ncbi:MAG: M28 family peptidase [Candidatus Marinimicrobia bacterium]|nr:M28 family peptidase [Candidatus Neomarinimicrobiota bacterium]MBL7011132.1 M28 family peptidase [Candidatus Neomarinimicrobiota bacterium]MBL7031506.1 M28 family peptidase [Candidatus Neomarinimicrobiota bacterium]
MALKKNESLLLIFFIFIGCEKPLEGWNKYVHSEDASNAQEAITGQVLRQHIATLSSDEFEGRFPGTIGEELTVDYLSKTFEKLGLLPGNPNGTWIQKATMTGVVSEYKAQFLTEEERWVMKVGGDIVGNSYRMQKEVDIKKAEMVFCGYGINAPEYGWNDFEGIDVNGKVIVVLVGDPPIEKDDKLDDSMFGGKAMTYYGRWSYKFEEGLRQGATGVLVVHETGTAGYPFAVLQGGYDGEQLMIEDPNLTPLAFQGWIPLATADRLFEMSGLDYQALKESAVRPDFKAVSLSSTFTSKMTNSVRRFDSNNIVAKYEGTDPELKDEYIIYTAHWDHLGKNIKLEGDQIYNGANDNALGTGIIMNIAEAFSKLKNGSKRSILFLAVTAEEQGLLGATYYSINPLVPLEKTVAVMNIDAMGNTYGKTKDLIVVGKGNSELDIVLEYAAEQDGKYLIPDAEPEKGFYYRSDHFAFAKQGVPALYVDGGLDVVGKGMDYGHEKKAEYTNIDYHAVSDEIKDDWDFSGMVEDARILFRVGYAIGQHDVWPQWSEGTEFKATREAMLKSK